ncbi:MAG: type 11 [Planctomycetota bacterium]|nr:MAG: type 11 [Planctomycetota bacterium]
MPKQGLIHRLGCIWRNQTLLRILMDEGLASETIRGRTVDVGGGRHQTYLGYLKQEGNASIEASDASISGIDYEKDRLPYDDASVDSEICCNLLEHIYNHRHLLAEMRRILKPGGPLVGFVPFLFVYHPDPQDYFRYTKTALVRLLTDSGFADATAREIGGGPFLLNFNTIAPSLPRFLRVLVYPFYAVLDRIFLCLRPLARERYPLGYIFSARAAGLPGSP